MLASHGFTNYHERFTDGDVALANMKDREYSSWLEDEASDNVGVRMFPIILHFFNSIFVTPRCVVKLEVI